MAGPVREFDDATALLLAEFDDRLRSASESLTTATLSADEIANEPLAEAKEFLLLIESVWPRRGNNAETPPSVPKSLGRFSVQRVLGHGGVGIVYLASDPLLKREVAIKVPRLEMSLTPALRQRFLREARAAALLNHPNIIPTLEVGEFSEFCFIVYPFCQGPSLAQWLEQNSQPLPCKTAARLVEQLALAMAHAHQRGVLHRDLKPSNILFPTTDDLLSANPLIADFGLAKVAEDADDLTRTGTMLGTPGYMSPEQTRNAKDLGPACDIWGLGVILYELLTRQRPFSGPTPVDVARAIREQTPVSPRRLRRDVSADLETICLKCLAKDPGKRYSSAFALADDLRRFQEDRPVHARPVPWHERVWDWGRRRPAYAALFVLLVFAITAGAVGTALYIARLQDLVASAEREREAKKAESDANRRSKLHADRAAEEAARLHRLRYVVDIRTAFHSIRERNPEAARLALDRWSKPMGEDPRGLEWYELKRQVTNQQVRIVFPGLAPIDDETDQVRARSMHAFAMSRDCRLAATMCDEQNIKIQDTESWQTLVTIPGASGGHRFHQALAFSPDGKTLAAAYHVRVRKGLRRPGITIWNWQTKTAIADVVYDQNPASGTMDLAFDSGGQTLLVRSDQSIYAHPVANLSDRNAIHDQAISKIAFSADGNLLALANVSDKTIEVRDFPSLALRHALPWQPYGPCIHLCFSGDSRSLAYGNHTALWITATEKPNPKSISSWDTQSVTAVAFSQDGEWLHVGTMGGGVQIYSTKTLKVCYDEMDSVVTHLAPTPDGRRVFVRSPLGRIRVVAATWPPPPESVDTRAGRLYSVAFSPGGTHLAVGGHGPGVRIFDAGSGKVQHTLASAKEIFSLAFSPDGQTLAAGCNDGRIQRWSVVDWHPLPALEGHAGRVGGLAYTPDGGRLLSMSWDKTCRLWSTTNSRTEKEFAGPFNHFAGMAMSPAGNRFAWVGENDLSIRVWHIEKNDEQIVPFVSKGRAVCYSPDGRWLAASNADGKLFLYDTQTNELRYQSAGHKRGVRSLSFSPDGKTLASAGLDGVVKIHDAASFLDLAALHGPRDELRALAWSPDGSTLAAVGHDGHLWIWRYQR